LREGKKERRKEGTKMNEGWKEKNGRKKINKEINKEREEYTIEGEKEVSNEHTGNWGMGRPGSLTEVFRLCRSPQLCVDIHGIVLGHTSTWSSVRCAWHCHWHEHRSSRWRWHWHWHWRWRPEARLLPSTR